MTGLFELEGPTLHEEIRRLNLPSYVVKWLEGVLECGCLKELLNGLIKNHSATNVSEALLLLAEAVPTHSGQQGLAIKDFKGRNYQHPVKKLSLELGLASAEIPEHEQEESTEKKQDHLYRLHGAEGHRAVARILSGLSVETNSRVEQLSLLQLGSTNVSQTTLFSYQEEELLPSCPSDCDLQRLEEHWLNMVAAINGKSHWYEQFLASQPGIKDLCQLLAPYFASSIRKLLGFRGFPSEYLNMFTFMSWGAFLLEYCKNTPYPVFSEVSVLPPSQKLSMGRVDALKVVSIDGREPNERELSMLRRMVSSKFNSIGHLAKELSAVFGKKVILQVIDWKFAVGDAVGNSSIISLPNVEEGIGKHVEQVQRYLTLSVISCHLLKEHNVELRWDSDGSCESGQLVYFLPTVPPITKSVLMGPDEREAFFRSRIVAPWAKAENHADLRHASNTVVRHLKHQLNGNSAVVSSKTKQNISMPILEPPKEQPLVRIIESSRTFVDKFGIIEVLGEKKDGTPQYFMHADVLLEALRSGKVKGNTQTLPRHAMICCIMPGHNDKTPSMHVDFQKLVFKCFGKCGVNGRILKSSIPSEWNLNFVARKVVTNGLRRVEDLAMPERVEKIFARTQVLLQEFYSGSKAVDYLATERKIDPDFAFGYGAGCCDNRLVEALLDEGYSLGDMYACGLVSFSPNIKPDYGLAPLLTRRGIRKIRKAMTNRKGEQVYGLPFLKLANRLTFPLTLFGKITNFYGRSFLPCRKEFHHRKLDTKGIPQGGFNMEALESPSNTIIVNEAIIDALTLDWIGYGPVVSYIGGINYTVIEAIARSGKDIALGLDNDAPGRENFEKIAKKIWNQDFKGELSNFTEQFLVRHPTMEPYKDFNLWWTKKGYLEFGG